MTPTNWGAIVLTVLLLSSVGCRSRKADEAGTKPAPGVETPQLRAAGGDSNVLQLSRDSAGYAQLKLAEVVEESLAAPLEVTGRVAVNEDRTVRVGSLFTGRILDVSVKVGDRVAGGQMLARMHTHEVHEAQSEYAKAQSELSQRKTEAAHAKALLARAERLFQAKALSQNELDKAGVDYQAAQQAVVRAEAELERAVGHREHLGLPEKLDYDAPVVIRAPAPGVVMKREITPGASVNPGDNLFFISDLSSVWVIAEVPEKNLSSLRSGAPVLIKVAAYPGETFPARLARVGEALNPETRTVEVRCVADNRHGRLKPEMYATVGLALAERRGAAMIPDAALQEIGGQAVVFVARGEGRFERRVVQAGRSQAGMVEILAGVARGERVVTEGSFLLKSEFSKDKLKDEE
jgi:membrane fusion protein, heavy metal efflux system